MENRENVGIGIKYPGKFSDGDPLIRRHFSGEKLFEPGKITL